MIAGTNFADTDNKHRLHWSLALAHSWPNCALLRAAPLTRFIILQLCRHIGRCGFVQQRSIFYRALLFNSCPAMMSSIEVELHPVVRVWQQSHENGDTNHRHRAIVETVTPMIGHQSQTSTHANHSPTWHSLTESQQVGHRVIWERSRWQQFLGRSIWQNRDFTFKRTNNGY